MIRKATENDLDRIEEIYNSILDADEHDAISSTGWIKGIYPTRCSANDALARGDLYVMENECGIISSCVINKIQVDVYSKCDWTYKAGVDEVMVIHTLVVDPIHSGKGYGSKMLMYYEEFALANGCSTLRLDTNLKNTYAQDFYIKHGYVTAGIQPCIFNGIPDVMLVLFEKQIN